MKTKKVSEYLQFETMCHALPPAQKKQMIDSEKAMYDKDQLILETKALKNELEAYSYEMRNSLGPNGSLEQYSDPAVRATFLAEVSQTIDWLYGEGENALKEAFQERLTKFRASGDPIKERKNFRSEYPVYEKMVKEMGSNLNLQVAGMTTDITEKQTSDVFSLAGDIMKFIDDLRKEVDTKPLHEDISVKLEKLQPRIDKCKNSIKKILSQPKPKPPADEKKPEDAKDGSKKEGDTEMKDESKK
jgi:hypothetical protein